MPVKDQHAIGLHAKDQIESAANLSLAGGAVLPSGTHQGLEFIEADVTAACLVVEVHDLLNFIVLYPLLQPSGYSEQGA